MMPISFERITLTDRSDARAFIVMAARNPALPPPTTTTRRTFGYGPCCIDVPCCIDLSGRPVGRPAAWPKPGNVRAAILTAPECLQGPGGVPIIGADGDPTREPRRPVRPPRRPAAAEGGAEAGGGKGDAGPRPRPRRHRAEHPPAAREVRTRRAAGPGAAGGVQHVVPALVPVADRSQPAVPGFGAAAPRDGRGRPAGPRRAQRPDRAAGVLPGRVPLDGIR